MSRNSCIYTVNGALTIDLVDISYITELDSFYNWTIGLKGNQNPILVEIIDNSEARTERKSLVSAWKSFNRDR